jgi:hypothetical protein
MAKDNEHSPKNKSINESNAIDANKYLSSGVDLGTADHLSEHEIRCETERMPKKETITT